MERRGLRRKDGRDGHGVASSCRDGPHHPQVFGSEVRKPARVGLWVSQFVLDGDMHRAAAFLDKN